MGLGDILSKSLSFSFSDLTKYLMVGIGIIICDLDASLGEVFGQDSFIVIIAFIIAVLFSFVMAGYSVNVTKKGIENSKGIPSYDLKNNFIDGLKLFVVFLFYFIIPIIITLVLLVVFDAFGEGFGHITAALGIWALVAIIIFIIFGILGVAAQARYAISRSIGYAISIGDVVGDVKRIGILKIILFLIVEFILLIVYSLILEVVPVVPVIGTMVTDVILGGFLVLFINYGVGLLYSE
ncbi:DUF4013 domain-containing protein [Methanobrevibacter sp.]|uniref:DUF4013 domain-containing protein n=1 Tax=Methanobrevibacter sp. TaxID=66852 RepID=UPI0038900018